MASEVEIRAPAEQTEGTRSQILRWLKSVGDTVAENEPLIELETDKVTVEVASPASGTLREILKDEQEEIGPGDLLGRIESAEAGVPAGGGQQAGQNGNVGTHPETAGNTTVGAETVGPEIKGLAHAANSGSTPARICLASQDSRARQSSRAEDPGSAAAPQAAAQSLSPAVRRLLAERGLDVSQVSGTGQGGRITVADVIGHGTGKAASETVAAVGSTGASAGGASAGSASTGAPAKLDSSALSATGPSHRVPHTATRKRIAEHMVQSLLHTAPHVTTVFEADLTAVLDHRQRNKEDFARRGAPLTLTAYFLQATVAAIRAVPEANSRWTDSALEIFESMHIGVATALQTGLVVPVLRDVQSRDLFETAKGLEDLVSRARDGRLAPTDVRGGTFTISNHGVSGSLVATPIIINQPQAAILGIGKLEKRPVVSGDEEGGEDRIIIRPRCYVTLTIDHRVMDGHQANRFLQTFVARLDNQV
jgi:2-oxoglutarate dehydrogenase E2 component (dihydrolipoamide succinyltransferase)